ncbi:hypothetical protein DPMN_152343 [Dreissena polymorpha]|uniref:Uncharacterized protein n=1 Tax=Dreissena polymorpha TaxID=45954 RepID=A0A9D4J529_DREPO|nr:hypothetical protein DPMN_152343 [Dreissena polymorpha]
MAKLSIWVHKNSPREALYCLNIEYLSLIIYDNTEELREESLSQSLSSLIRLQQLIINVDEDIPGLWEALYGRNIKKLGVFVKCKVKYKESLARSISSLTRLETLSYYVHKDSSGLWEAVRGLSIKSLTLSNFYGGFSLNHKELLSQPIVSLTQHETLNISLWEDSTGLLEVLYGLNIKSLRLSYIKWKAVYAESFSQSLLSLAQLETLAISVNKDSPGLWKALHGLHIKSLILRFNATVKHAESLSESLSTLTQQDKLRIKMECDSPGLWEIVHGLNIKSQSLNSFWESSAVEAKYAESFSQKPLVLMCSMRVLVCGRLFMV